MPLTSSQVRDLIELYVNNNPLMAFQNNRMKDILLGQIDLMDLLVIGAGGEPTIAFGTVNQYWRGDKTWQTLNSAAVGLGNVPNINATIATNLSSGTVPSGRFGNFTIPLTALMATGTPDSTMALFFDGWRVPTIPTDAVPTAASTLAVQSGGVFDALALKATIASPTFTGVPAAPTATPGTNTTQLATTAFVTAAVAAATTGVSSFNTRTGAVVSATNDYTWAQINKTISSFGDITTRSAGDISSGTLADARLSGNVILGTLSYSNPSWLTALAWVKITGTPTTMSGYGITDGVTLNGSETLTNKTISGSSNTLTNIAQTSVTNLVTDLSLKANIASPTFTGVAAAPTATPGTNTTQLATTAFVTAAIAAATTGVSSWAGRTGAVVPLTNDYTWAQINKTTSSFADITTRSADDISSGTLAVARLHSTVVLTTGSYANPAWITSLNFLTKVHPTITGTPDGTKFLKDDGTWGTVPGGNPGTVTNVSGTTNRITVTNPTSTPVIDIAATYAGQTTITTLGTVGTGVWNATAISDTYISSAATWNGKQAGNVHLTSISGLTPSNDDILQYKLGAWTNVPFPSGIVSSVSGTANRITSTGGATPVIDISSSYVGQSSIVILGTITTGVWNGTAVTNAFINSVAWTKITSTPTTIAGYGITDGVTLTGTETLTNKSLTSPSLTGVPTAPTAAPGTNTTQIASTAFVTAAVAAATTGVSSFNGRTGVVVAAINDYTWAQINKGTSSLADITTRSAGDLNSGVLLDARLSSNVPLKDTANTFTAAQSVPDEVYGASWNNSMQAPTKNALFDIIETKGNMFTNAVNTMGSSGRILFNTVNTSDYYIKVGGLQIQALNLVASYLFNNLHYNGTDYTLNQAGSGQLFGIGVDEFTFAGVASGSAGSTSAITTIAKITRTNGLHFEISNAYINFSSLTGSAGYGFRNNAGQVQFKHSGGSWADIGSGGGGGSGTVNAGTANRLAYYAATGTAVSELGAMIASRAVISDTNGLPTYSATTSTELGFVSGVTSAIQTQLNNINLRYFNVKAYGAVGNGSTNDQAAIQSAIDAAEVSGGVVYFPDGNYKIDSQITCTERDVKFWGSGKSIITSTFATGDILYVSPTGTPANDGTQNHGIQGLEIRNLDFQTSIARTSGAALHIRYSEHAVIHNVRIGAMKSTDYTTPFSYDHFDGIFLEFQGACNLSQIQIYPHHTGLKISGAVPAGGWPYFNYDGHLHGNWQIWHDKHADSVGIHLGGNNGGFRIEQGNIVLAGTGVLVDKTLTAQTNRELFFGHFFVDSIEGYGYNIAENSVNIIKWDNSWIAGVGRGPTHIGGFPYGAAINVAVQPSTTKFFVDGMQIYAAYGGGIQASGGQWTITSSLIYDVGEGTDGGDAISMLNTNHTNIVITGNNIHNIGNATKGMGIRLDSATTNIDIVGNNIFDAGQDEYSGPADNGTTIKIRANTNISEPAGSGAAAGASTQIQYNTAGSFDASSALTFNFSTGSLGITKSQNAGSLAVITNTNAGVDAFAGFQLVSDGGSSYMYRTSIAYGTVVVADATTIQDAGGGDIVFVGTAEVARFKNAGNFIVPASTYMNFGTTSGSGGYGFWDDAGTLKWRNSGGAWATFGVGGGGGGAGDPGGSDSHVQYNSSGVFEGNAGLTYNGSNALGVGTTTSGGFLVLNANLTAAAGIVHVASGTNMLAFDFSNRAEYGGTVDVSSGRQLVIHDYVAGAGRLGMNASGDLFVGVSNTVYGLKITQSGDLTVTNSVLLTKSQDAGTLATITNTNAGTSAFAGLKFTSDGGDSYIYRTSAAYSIADSTVIQDAGGGDIVFLGAAEVGRFKNGGNLILPASTYANWGTTSGTSGYGFRDNAGTMEFKNSGGSWAAFGGGGGMSNPMTTTGDIIYSSSGSTPDRLGIGTAGQVLTVSGGVPIWVTPEKGVKANSIVSTIGIANTETVVVYTIAGANTLQTGSIIKIQAFCSQSGTNAATPTVRIRIGGTTLTGAISATLTGAVGGSAVTSNFKGLVTIRTIGASGTANGGIVQNKQAVAVAANTLTTTVTINTTISNFIELTFVSGNSSNTYTFQTAAIELIHPTPLS